VEGIFRLNGSAKRIKDLQEVFDHGSARKTPMARLVRATGSSIGEGRLLHHERYIRTNQLPEPIVPLEFYERFREPLRIYQRQVLEGKNTAISLGGIEDLLKVLNTLG
jgi:hypothetical protein